MKAFLKTRPSHYGIEKKDMALQRHFSMFTLEKKGEY